MQMSVVVFVSLKHFPSKASASITLCTKTAATNVLCNCHSGRRSGRLIT